MAEFCRHAKPVGKTVRGTWLVNRYITEDLPGAAQHGRFPVTLAAKTR